MHLTIHSSWVIKLVIPTFISFMACNSNTTKEPIPPNIIFIMSDDHTTQAFGIYGSRLASLNPTPTLDQLAQEGMIFDNCFVTNSICVPSRAAIITGQHSQTNGVIDLEGKLSMDQQYLPQEMKKLGYQTAIVGKWHLRHEPAFDYYQVLPGQGKYFDPEFRVQGEKPWPENTVETQGHSSDVITDITLDWFENKRDPNQPFFLMQHYKAPHDDFEHAPRYHDYLEEVIIPEPESLYDNKTNGSVATRGINDSLTRIIGSSVSRRNLVRNQAMNLYMDSTVYRAYRNAQEVAEDELKPFINTPEEKVNTSIVYQEYLKRYLRCVKGVDDNIKRLLDYLKSKNLLDNTVIIYTGDQGFMLGEHDYIDKRWMYEESMRMPFFVRYPESIKSGTRTSAIINNTDFAPTMIALAGGAVPEYMQGRSFKEILESGIEPEHWPQETYYRYWMHMAHRHANPAHFGIRTKDYKLIFFYGRYWVDTDDPQAKWNRESWGNDYARHTPVAWEFYDLKQDPKEMTNQYHNPDYAETIENLKERLWETREDLNETDERYPHIQQVIDQYKDS